MRTPHILALCAVLTLIGPRAEGQPAESVDQEAGLAELRAVFSALAGLTRIEAQFEQTRTAAAFAVPLASSGRFSFEREGALVWAYEQPWPSTFTLTSDRVVAEYPELGTREEIPIQDSEQNSLFSGLAVWGADPDALLSQWEVTVLSRAPLSVRLEPREEDEQALFAHLSMVYSAEGYLEQLAMAEADGDETRIRFTDSQLWFAGEEEPRHHAAPAPAP